MGGSELSCSLLRIGGRTILGNVLVWLYLLAELFVT